MPELRRDDRGAEGGTCTLTTLRAHASQPCASTVSPNPHMVAARGLAPLSAACRAAVLLLDDAASVSYLLARFIPRQGLHPDRPGQMSPAQEDGGDPEWWTWSGSNRQPSPCEGDALPVAPQAQMVAVAGLEPTISRLWAW